MNDSKIGFCGTIFRKHLSGRSYARGLGTLVLFACLNGGWIHKFKSLKK